MRNLVDRLKRVSRNLKYASDSNDVGNLGAFSQLSSNTSQSVQQAVSNNAKYDRSFNRSADENDVYYCYRLLLDREPDSAGWATWTTVVKNGKTSLKTLVLGFLSSSEFKNRNLLTSTDHAKNDLIDLGEFKIYASRQDWAVGKAICEGNSYEPHISRALRELLSPGMVFVDIGANIGYFSLMAASLIGSQGKVFAFEPNQQNCNCLFLSAKVNGFENIDLYPFAVAEKKTGFVYDNMGSNGAISDITDDLNVINSRVIVRSIVLDETLHDVEQIDVLKIDIEGAEFRALQGATQLLRQHRPTVLSEFSPPALSTISKVSGREYLQFLIDLDYQISVFEGADQQIECGTDLTRVINLFDKHQASHIDILASPQ